MSIIKVVRSSTAETKWLCFQRRIPWHVIVLGPTLIEFAACHAIFASVHTRVQGSHTRAMAGRNHCFYCPLKHIKTYIYIYITCTFYIQNHVYKSWTHHMMWCEYLLCNIFIYIYTCVYVYIYICIIHNIYLQYVYYVYITYSAHCSMYCIVDVK